MLKPRPAIEHAHFLDVFWRCHVLGDSIYGNRFDKKARWSTTGSRNLATV